jgi:Cu-processing system permease protein
MELRLVWIIAARELREALKNRWLLAAAAGFAALFFALSYASSSSAGYAGLSGFGRTAASLVNALLLFVPLTGLIMGAGALAGDRERGSLAYLLTQPVSTADVFLGKVLGSAIAVCLALAAGFALAALGLSAGTGGEAGAYLLLVVYSILLALASLGLGFLISSLTRTSSSASGIGLLVWLGLVFFADLLMVTLILSMRPTPALLFGMLVSNPLQAFKVGAIYSLRSSLDALGPVGQFAVHRFGDQLAWVPIGLLSVWALAGFGLAYGFFVRRRDR